MLEIRNISKNFGGFRAVDNCSLTVESGAIHGLIGPNGAGKSTVFNTIAGLHRPDSGSVMIDGAHVTGLAPHEMFKQGLLRTFQIPHEFSNVRVINNLCMVADSQIGEHLATVLFTPSRYRKQEQKNVEKASEILDFLGLSHVRYELAGNLSGGQKKLLELGRTLMVDAKVVLLDELGAGINHTLLNTLADNIQRLNEQMSQTFFIIEHNMQFISRLCHRVTVMAEGKVIAEGTPQKVLQDPVVVEAYFGGKHAH